MNKNFKGLWLESVEAHASVHEAGIELPNIDITVDEVV